MPVISKSGATTELEMRFPTAGIDLQGPFSDQRPRQVEAGNYARSTPLGINVRSYEATTGRGRGGTRAGLAKWMPAPLVAGWIVQNLDVIVTSGFAAPGGGSVSSASGRVVTLVGGSQGNVFVCNAGDTVWTSPTNMTGNTPPLIFTGRYFSDSNQQKMYFADGSNWVYYQPSDNTLRTWTASAGSLPIDADGNTPRLIATWRGRTVLSGLLKDQQNWFMSRVGDPTDFDYAPLSPSSADAIAGNNAPFGKCGDMVTGLAPFSDDTMLCGMDHTLAMFRGDPGAGGSLDLVSDAIGMAFGKAWCMDPYGTMYFVSNKMGLYSIRKNGLPDRISQAIEQTLQEVDTGACGIRLIWDDRYQGLHVFITELAAPAVTRHFFFEQRTSAWWYDEFANTNHNPVCCCVFDGNDPSDRAPLVGGWDGYVRVLSPDAEDDDGTPIASRVLWGPLLSKTFAEITLKELQAALGTASGSVNFAILVGATAEAALAAVRPFRSGTFGPSRGYTQPINASAHAIYIDMTATNPWAAEALRVVMEDRGMVRGRGA